MLTLLRTAAVGLLTLCSTLASAGEFALTLSRYHWDPVEQAAYYRGSFESQSRRINFQTSSQLIRLPSGLTIELSSYDRANRLIGPVSVTETPIPGELGQHKPKADTVESYLASIDELLEAEGAFRIKDGADWTPPPPKVPDYNWSIGALLGLGSESLKMKGGVADYSGNSLTGDTLVWGRWEQKAGLMGTVDQPWGAEVAMDFHNHHASVTAENTLDGTSDTRTEKQYRVRFHGVALYKLPQGTDPAVPRGWTLEAGIGGMRLPVFRLRDANTGRTAFSDAQVQGPRLGARYFDTYARGLHWEAAAALVAAASGSEHRGQSSALKFTWMWDWTDDTQILASGAFHLETLTGTIDCPTGADCTSSSSARTQQVVFYAGAQHEL